MRKSYLNATILTAGLLASTSVFADAKFRPRVDVGLANYELTIIEPPFADSTSKSTYLKAGIGGTIITGRWYFDLGYNGSINAEADESFGGTSDLVRKDLTLTAGYVFQSNWTVFGGYKSGASEFSNYTGDTTGFTDEFTADGLYAGAGVNFPSGKNVFSINAALAILNGEYSSNAGTEFSADSAGLSFGAGYSMPFSNTSGLAIKANYQYYDFQNFEDGAGFVLDNVEVTESILSLDVGYYATF